MNIRKIKTEVIHSESKDAWNVVGKTLGEKYKIAIIPYLITGNLIIDTNEKSEALNHALFISKCFNQSDEVLETFKF